jgi:prepilin-type N-terminal cleavage/methylation domain-containing protein
MEIIRTEKGVTLIEVLISMVILSIVFMSFMSFFPQMGLMNRQNEDKTQAINTAKQLLIQWQNNGDLKTYLSSPTTTVLPVPPQIDTDGKSYIFNTSEGKFAVKVKIKITPSKTSRVLNAHLIIIQLFNIKGNVVGETYGYITR